MDNDMLAELDEVVQLDGPDGRFDAAFITAIRFLRARLVELEAENATLADMAKRLEAAERKVSRLTAMRNEWERDAREHLMTFGQHLPASVECLVERFDAAIDATQEGEG